MVGSPRPRRARARLLPGWRSYGPRCADRTRRGRRSPPVLDSWLLSPSYLLWWRCAFSLLGRVRPWGRVTGDGHHPFIRLHHTDRAHPARLKREAHFQGSAGYGGSTSHAGLLAPVAPGAPEVAPSARGPPETRLHSWGAVVSVECSSKTLSAGWQLCRKCSVTLVGPYYAAWDRGSHHPRVSGGPRHCLCG